MARFLLVLGCFCCWLFSSFSNGQSISSVYGMNAPVSGSISVTIFSTNFAVDTYSAKLYIGTNYVSTAAIWMSNTATTAKLPQGTGNSYGLVAEIARQGVAAVNYTLPDAGGKLSYNTPMVSSLTPTNLPALEPNTLTILGQSFGIRAGVTAINNAKIGGNLCSNGVSWTSDTAITCMGIKGDTVSGKVEANIQQSTLSRAFSYNLPTFGRANFPTSGAISLTIVGNDMRGDSFPLYDPYVRLGRTVQSERGWISNSWVKVKVPLGSNDNNEVVITGAGPQLARTWVHLNMYFSYDLPVVTWVGATNSPKTGGVSVTIFSQNLALVTWSSASSRVGWTTSQATSWLDIDRVVGRVAVGSATGWGIAATMLKHKASFTSVLDYDAFKLKAVQKVNGPPMGQVLVVAACSGSGGTDPSGMLRIGGTTCENSKWVSDSSTACKVAASSWQATGLNNFGITVLRSLSTQSKFFTFDDPFFPKTNGPTTGGYVVSIVGWGFPTNSTPSITIGPRGCEASAWLSVSLLTCKVPAGGLVTADSNVVIYQGSKAFPKVYSYDALVMCTVAPVNIPTTGATSLTLMGKTLGMADPTPQVRVGVTANEAFKWIADSSMRCKGMRSRPACIGTTASVNTKLSSTPPAQITVDTPLDIRLWVLVKRLEFNQNRFKDAFAAFLSLPGDRVALTKIDMTIGNVQLNTILFNLNLTLVPDATTALTVVDLHVNVDNWRDVYLNITNDALLLVSQMRSQLLITRLQTVDKRIIDIRDPVNYDVNLQALSFTVIAGIVAAVVTIFIVFLGFMGYLYSLYKDAARSKINQFKDRMQFNKGHTRI